MTLEEAREIFENFIILFDEMDSKKKIWFNIHYIHQLCDAMKVYKRHYEEEGDFWDDYT